MSMINIVVKILPKKEVLDVKGRAIAETLKRQGHSLEKCHYGKLLILSIKTNNPQTALKKAKEMAQSVLCNKLVEDYELEVLS